jgi:hypothetical protein
MRGGESRGLAAKANLRQERQEAKLQRKKGRAIGGMDIAERENPIVVQAFSLLPYCKLKACTVRSSILIVPPETESKNSLAPWLLGLLAVLALRMCVLRFENGLFSNAPCTVGNPCHDEGPYHRQAGPRAPDGWLWDSI